MTQPTAGSATSGSTKLQIVLVITILLVAVFGTYALIAFNKQAPKTYENYRTPKVSVIETAFSTQHIDIQTRGIVQSRVALPIQPEISGKIVWVSPKWVNGGFFKKGEKLFSIEKTRYENDVAQATYQLREAESQLIQELGHAHVAEREWQGRLSKDNEAQRKLALRKPQVASAKARVSSSKESLRSTQTSLNKTDVYAPFDGLLAERTMNAGQFASAGQQAAILYAVDNVEIRVPLTFNQVGFIELPGIGSSSQQPVTVTAELGSASHTFEGKLLRTEGVLDQRTGILHAVVSITDPYGLQTPRDNPLHIGTFVEIKIPSQSMAKIISLPRHILRAGNHIWVVNDDNRLENRQVTLLPTKGDTMYVYEGLEAGEKVVISAITHAVNGKLVEIVPNDIAPEHEAPKSPSKKDDDSDPLAQQLTQG
ncbi:MAG: efflux RND transporter periplasmic adaptor subunit [Cellvibrionales bacterium]|nr:efflux RND transporter periplasmic adaptor subunit [Cellvibrionales bacterium]